MKDLTNELIREGIYLDKRGFAYKVFYSSDTAEYLSTEYSHNQPCILNQEVAGKLFRVTNPLRLETLLARANRMSVSRSPVENPVQVPTNPSPSEDYKSSSKKSRFKEWIEKWFGSGEDLGRFPRPPFG